MKLFGWRRKEERAYLARIASALEQRGNGGGNDAAQLAQLVKAHNLLVAQVDGLTHQLGALRESYGQQLAALGEAHAKLRGKVYKDPEFHTPQRARGAPVGGDVPLPAPLGAQLGGLPDVALGGDA